METLKEDAIHHTAMKLAEELKSLSIYKSFYSDVQKLVSSPNVKKEDFKQTLQQAMKEKGLDTKLRNTVFHWVRSQNKQNKLDPLTSLSKASAQWEKRIHKSLNSMCSDLETSLAKVRSQSEQEELSAKWSELSTYNLDLSKYRPVYAPKDFLEVLLTLSGYVPFTKEGEPKWEFAHLPLQVKNLDQLRKIYLEWTNGEPLLGVNPNMPSAVSGFSTIEAERIGLGERVTGLGYAPVIQEYLKKGSPQCLRAKLWAQVLGADVGAQQTAYFNRLKKSVLEVDLMIDKLIFKDVQLTASNDDQYFVFEDLLYQVNRHVLTVLQFSRQVELYLFMASLCTRRHSVIYMMILCNCILFFERFIFAIGINCIIFLHTRRIRVVFKWIMRAFSGHLPPDQLLLLWDTILGYDCLEILPLLAVAILSFRKENIFQVNTIQNVDAVLADLSTISVIPLLQLTLMKPQ
ncbi:TBC1 domain family member 19 isoform X3 [Pieris napi]|uniref:TBC1 domain family member 19 isoform X3 n=1 Tax=Pieris napi TaxID=78633 RepID=UPI001FBBB90E|nr:TBC1 domain family member 19 isoform X3 [Pieris napi]